MRRFTLRRCLAAAFAVLAWGMTDPAWTAEEINVSGGGYAIHGYDPVAYHLTGMPARGSESFTATHEGTVYLFASAVNRDAFLAAPDAFVPAYGGWCSYGVRIGRKFDVDPLAFRIVDGRLYLQLDLGTQKVWADDVERNIAIADRIWPSIRSTPAAQLGE